jgi:hypothetical protein
MRTRHLLLATGAALALTLAGCDSPDDDSAPSPRDTTFAVPERPALVGAPDEGTCWRVPADAVVDENYWFDDSGKVPCSKPHTTETVDVLRLTNASVAEARETAGVLCWDRVRAYLGVDRYTWVPWAWAAFLPSGKQVADGANWMRCDAVFPAIWDFASVRTTTGSARGVAKDPPAELRACLDERPQERQQSFVSCDQPHQYEQTGTLALIHDLEGVQQYPSPSELEAAAQRQCADSVEDRNNVSVTAAWDPRTLLRESTEIFGACFMFSKNGQSLPPLR